jgi:hypothetical protein
MWDRTLFTFTSLMRNRTQLNNHSLIELTKIRLNEELTSGGYIWRCTDQEIMDINEKSVKGVRVSCVPLSSSQQVQHHHHAVSSSSSAIVTKNKKRTRLSIPYETDKTHPHPYQHPPNAHYLLCILINIFMANELDTSKKWRRSSRKHKSELEKECRYYVEDKEKIKSKLRSQQEVEKIKSKLAKIKLELAVEQNRPKIKLGKRIRRIEEVEKIKLELAVERNIRIKEVEKIKLELAYEQNRRIEEVEKIKSNHNAQIRVVCSINDYSDPDNSLPLFSNNDNNKSKKVGINEDEIKLLEDIMEVITTNQKKCLMDVGAKKEDVDVLVKSSFCLVGKGPWTTILQSSYKTLGEIHSTETNNVCMQVCHQNLKDESYCMVDHWQMANVNIGTGMGEKNSLSKAFGQSGADQIGMLENFLSLVKDKVNIVSMGQCALSGNLGALSDVHVAHPQCLAVAGSGNQHLVALNSWRKMSQLVHGTDEYEAFIHVASSVYKALVLCSSSTTKRHDSQELYDKQQLALVSVS